MHQPGTKPRPVCILTRDEAIPVLQRVMVAEATTTRRGIESEVDLDESDGMPRSCVLSLDNVLISPKARLGRRITTLSPARMHEVCEALRFATGC
jgi:mRNA interferase MazF